MPSITVMICDTLPELSEIDFIDSTTWSTTLPPRTATSHALVASMLACFALSVFCRTVEVNCSMLAAVSSSEAACSSVRCDRSRLPWAISPAADLIDSADDWMPATMPLSCCRMPSSDAIRLL